MNRRIALLAAVIAVAGVSVAGVGIAHAGGAAADGTQATTPVKVTVTMSDFRFRLSKASVPRGRPVVFTIINRGPSPHDFDVRTTKGTAIIASGRRTTQRATFRRAGTYRYVCTVPRHVQFGMVGNLRVT
jgi:plastocyanin